MTLLDAINAGVSNFPIPMLTLQAGALARGVELEVEASTELLKSREYRLLEADMKMWIVTGSNISQGDISLDMVISTREVLRSQANAVYRELGDPKYDPADRKPNYGYKGSRL